MGTKATKAGSPIETQIAALTKELEELTKSHAEFAAAAKRTTLANKVRFIQLNAKLETLRGLLPATS